MKGKGSVYFKGIPTKVDVDRLVVKYGVPEEGTEISLREIAEVLAIEELSFRFKTVVSAWRRLLFRTHNVLMVGTGERTLVCADPETRVKTAVGKITHGRKSIGRGVVIAYQTDALRLTKDSKSVRNSIVGLNQKKLELALKVT